MLVNAKMKGDVKRQKIFLGDYNGIQRYDYYQYPFAKTVEEKMRNAFWNPNEISMTNDKLMFSTLPDYAQEQMINVWLFQTMADSVQNRGLSDRLVPLVTSSEWEAVLKTHSYFELIHSLSYSHILRGIFPDSTKIFDRMYEIEAIHNRFESEIDGYDTLLTEANEEIILELCLRVYALERLKFGASFLTTYLINHNYGNKIQGSTRIIKLINADEDYHTVVFAGLINILRKTKSEGFKHLFDSGWAKSKAIQVFNEAIQGEMEWGKYLMSIGKIPSLNEDSLFSFLNHYAWEALHKIGIDSDFKSEETDLIRWFKLYRDISKDKVAQQEAEGLSYNIGLLEDDIGIDKLEIVRGVR